MGAVAPNSEAASIRKAIVLQHAYIGRGRDVRRHHHVTLKALRLAETAIEAGHDIDVLIEVLAASKAAEVSHGG